jgi:hypothetical protein
MESLSKTGMGTVITKDGGINSKRGRFAGQSGPFFVAAAPVSRKFY